MSAAQKLSAPLDVTALPDYRWMANGQSVFAGSLRALYQRLDALFVRWAGSWAADEVLYPVLVPAAELQRLDYFRSFPQLATFACSLHAEPENLQRFADGAGVDDGGAVALTEVAPVSDALTPAACYHVYIDLQGQRLDQPRLITTRNTCFRREARFEPMRRQAQFGMREIVCVGTADEVKSFLGEARERVNDLVRRIGLVIDWQAATDPFFNASANPKFLAQKIEPVKHEMVFGGDLAIGSINFHRNFFGETFAIERDGAPAFSGCLAFGMERWIYAFLHQYGPNQGDWPDLEELS